MKKSFIFLVYIFLFAACATQKPHYVSDYRAAELLDEKPEYSLFFFGGADKNPESASLSMQSLQKQFETVENGALILLGNNGLKQGMPDVDAINKRREAERILEAKLSKLKSFEGQVYIVPGNHDWGNAGKKGYDKLIQLEEYVEDFFGPESDVVVPGGGCPGPYEVHVNEGLVYLFLNTQWWFHGWEKPTCDMEDEFDYVVQLEDAIKRNINKKVIVVGHHPVYSNGAHGGNFPLSAHLTPPVLGTLNVWYRKYMGGLQDLAEIRYKTFSKGMEKILAQHPNAIYLSGHESSQQYHKINNQQHYIVSGAIAKASPTSKGNNARFAYGKPGFGRLNFYKNGDVFLEFWTGDELSFREKIFNHIYDPKLDEKQEEVVDYSGQTMTASATTKYNRKSNITSPGLMGNNYRKEWATEIKDIPVFDIDKERGGLEIVQRGGGQQTRSLRMQAKDGRQYTLRSVEKFADSAVPRALRGTIAANIIHDQISASHPYGALAIPILADAAGVHHTTPTLVYLKDDPRLGKYREDFANGVYLYEERPATDKWQDYEAFGKPRKIKSTFDLIESLQKKDKNFVNEEQVVRSRLFDILIGDWDRHDDQWRFAEFKVSEVGEENIPEKVKEKTTGSTENDHKYYEPIPRDRDQAFFLSDGSLIRGGSHKWGIPKFQGFHDEISDVSGLEFNARHFDRTFLVESTLEVWEAMAADLQQRITDEVIESSINRLPKEIYAINGDNIVRKLKKRRDDLHIYAKQHYLFLARTVSILGSKKAERFEVNRLNDRETEVKMYRIKENSGDIKFLAYSRVFKTDETEEIRLYGLGDNDQFVVTGKVKKGPLVRMIGGKGEDLIDDQSKVFGLVRKNIVYDKKKKTIIKSEGELRDRTSDKNDDINLYDRHEFKYNILMPLLTGGFNADDGVFIGGGFTFIKQKFRKTPYAQRHTLVTAIAPRSSSFNFKYKAEYNQFIGKWDFLYELDVFEPSLADFFYGYGNKTMLDEDAREEDAQYYRARYGQWIVKPEIRRVFGDIHSLKIGGYYRSVRIKDDENESEANRFIVGYPTLIGREDGTASQLLDRRRSYLATTAGYSLDSRDSKGFPKRGLVWNVDGKLVAQSDDEKNKYQSLSSNLSTYFTFQGSLQTTVAIRVGGQANFGDFEFYQAPRLGGLSTLRGYRRTRFAGDETFYQNTDVRIKLKEYKTPLFPGSLGITLIHDIGRVWTDQEDVALIDNSKETWHRGYGAGVWIAPLGSAVIAAEYTLSNDDESALFIRFGFFF